MKKAGCDLINSEVSRFTREFVRGLKPASLLRSLHEMEARYSAADGIVCPLCAATSDNISCFLYHLRADHAVTDEAVQCIIKPKQQKLAGKASQGTQRPAANAEQTEEAARATRRTVRISLDTPIESLQLSTPMPRKRLSAKERQHNQEVDAAIRSIMGEEQPTEKKKPSPKAGKQIAPKSKAKKQLTPSSKIAKKSKKLAERVAEDVAISPSASAAHLGAEEPSEQWLQATFEDEVTRLAGSVPDHVLDALQRCTVSCAPVSCPLCDAVCASLDVLFAHLITAHVTSKDRIRCLINHEPLPAPVPMQLGEDVEVVEEVVQGDMVTDAAQAVHEVTVPVEGENESAASVGYFIEEFDAPGAMPSPGPVLAASSDGLHMAVADDKWLLGAAASQHDDSGTMQEFAVEPMPSGEDGLSGAWLEHDVDVGVAGMDQAAHSADVLAVAMKYVNNNETCSADDYFA